MGKLSFDQLKSQGGTSPQPGQFVLPLHEANPRNPGSADPNVPCVIVESWRDACGTMSYALISASGDGLVLDRNEFITISDERAKSLMGGKADAEPKPAEPAAPHPGLLLTPKVGPLPKRRRSPANKAPTT